MFPSIDNHKGIAAVRKNNQPSTSCLVEALQACLTNNNSIFDNKHLIQTNGTAMGAANSCSYADIAIEEIDTVVLSSRQSDFSEIKFFGRFRDDCFSIWQGSINRLHEFLDLLNSICSSINFTMEIGYDKLCFLDVEISKVNNKLTTTVYSKPTNSHMYLHGQSCHPSSSINGISIGVATRLRRICSSDDEFDTKAKEYKGFLAARNHKPAVISQAFDSVRNIPREEVRNTKTTTTQISKVIISTEFNPRGPNIRKIINKHLDLINGSPILSKIFPAGSIVIANKRSKNLKELMVRADPYTSKDLPTEEPGYHPCGKRCDSCNNFVDHVNSFKCNATGKTFKLRKSITCCSKNVIYMCYCTNCKLQGIGSTVKWKARLSNYKSHVKKHVKSCNIARHFIENCCDGENPSRYMRFVLLDCVDNEGMLNNVEIEKLLLEKERFWIGTICAIHKGLNGFHDWRRSTRTQKAKDVDW